MRRIAWLLVCLMACGGGSTTSSDPGDDGSSGGTSSTTDTVTTDTTDTGWSCNEWYPCQDCGGLQCWDELDACLGSGSCSSALNTWASCVLECGKPSACSDAFSVAGGSPAAALVACVETECASECDL